MKWDPGQYEAYEAENRRLRIGDRKLLLYNIGRAKMSGDVVREHHSIEALQVWDERNIAENPRDYSAVGEFIAEV